MSDLSTSEMIMYNLGLKTPTTRFVAGFTITTGLLLLLRPRFAFLEDGTPRPWSLVGHKGNSATLIPWFFPGLLVGGTLGLFL